LKNLSELEGVSLGIVYNFQPCTAYFVRRELRESPSSHWQASAGSVYPLLARLQKRGLLASLADDGDKRGRKHFSVTRKGERAIKTWILAGAEPDMVAAIMDPIRSRMFFLSLLDTAQKKQYLDDLLELMEDFFEQTRLRLAQSPEDEDLYRYLAALGAMKTTQARLEWLRAVRKRIIKH